MQRSRRVLALAVTAALLAACTCRMPAGAQAAPDVSAKPVTFHFENVPLTNALKMLFQIGGVNYVLTPDAADVAAKTTVTSNMNEVPFQTALGSLFRSGHLAARFEQGVYYIGLADSGPRNVAAPGAPRVVPEAAAAFDERALRKQKVTLDLKNVDFEEALSELFEPVRVSYVLAIEQPIRDKITISMSNTPFEAALVGVLRSVDYIPELGYRIDGGILTVSAHSLGGPSADIGAQRFTLKLGGVDLRYAIKALFNSAGLNYSLDQTVKGMVTANLNGVPFRRALESILRSAARGKNGFTYTVEDGVYRFTHTELKEFIE